MLAKRMTLMACSVLLAGAGSCLAATIEYPERLQDEGKLNLYIRALQIDTEIYNDLVEDQFGGFPDGSKLGGTGIGAIVDYSSGYWGGFVGFDASLYGVAKIDSRQNSRDIFDDTSGSNKGFAKLGQGYLKFRHGGTGWVADMQVGRGRFDAGTLATLDTRIAPGSYQGARARLSFTELGVGPLPGELDFDVAYVNRSSPRDREDFERLMSNTGETIDGLYTYGFNYDLKAVEFSYRHGVAKDFNENRRYELTLQAPVGENGGVILNTQYYDFKRAGDIWRRDWLEGEAAYDDKASWLNVNLGILMNRLRLGLSYSETDAKLSNGLLGYAFYDHGDNVDGLMDAWTEAGNDFNNDGEKTWQVGAEYDFSGLSLFDVPLDGVKAMIIHKRGKFDADNPFTGVSTDITERQTEYRLYYRFDEKDYAGLSVGIIYTDYRIDQDFVSLVSAQPENVVTGKELRTYIDYAF
ncbi:OprD family outer membrane porin [Stutzerimonas nosocomialis]|uniref:OprD family outer membrane porin n=1 Tax=Stutzerimonas nosocomialis TaxID=1056496 RepID=UPI001F503801|nr:OprD family outer membrane porin [Stutzerimonas nosocomialis]